MTIEALPNDFFCSQLAQECGEQIAGTAAEATTIWLALEVPEAWGAKALAESRLPDPIKERLALWEETVPGTRLQLIKQGSGFASDAIVFYVGLSYEEMPVLYRFELETYENLLEINLAAVVDGSPDYAGYRQDEPIFLVCTNGRRDRCCAKWGVPVFQAMARYAGGQVWQTTHTGGHRFAATLIALPEGVCYGWLGPEDVAPLVDAHRSQRLYRLDRYRGRSCYHQIVQASEALLRQQTGVMDIGAYRVRAQEQVSETHWYVEFADGNENRYQLHVDLVPPPVTNPLSCGKVDKVTPSLVHLRDYHMR